MVISLCSNYNTYKLYGHMNLWFETYYEEKRDGKMESVGVSNDE